MISSSGLLSSALREVSSPSDFDDGAIIDFTFSIKLEGYADQSIPLQIVIDESAVYLPMQVRVLDVGQ